LHHSFNESQPELTTHFLHEIPTLIALCTERCLRLIGFGLPEGDHSSAFVVAPVIRNRTLQFHLKTEEKTSVRSVLPPTVTSNLKPDNVFLLHEFEPVIADFRLARLLDPNGVDKTNSIGTPIYTPA
jgi:hypothetical protein